MGKKRSTDDLIGDRQNSEPAITPSGMHLLQYVERYERLDEEKKTIADDMKDLLSEAKGNGLDVGILRLVLKRRKQDQAKLDEQETLFDLYWSALVRAKSGDTLEA